MATKRTVDFAETPLPEIYGANCFSDKVMRERLPKNIYKELKAVQQGGKELTLAIADVVAASMKDWALERGATHFTHWFQPLTGLTAEKHDSFINPQEDGTVIMDFSGKELIKGEPDASSFPSGGLRATFEARGYTAWDTTSPAFLKEDQTGITLYIPTAFVGYHGEALDKKVPLLRSMEAISTQSLRVLKALGNTSTSRVLTTVGPEQEYFLVDQKYYEDRLDLKFTGRTLFGLLPPKGQEMEDHYFGIIPERVADFMRELNTELWKLGVSAKTQHNEVAPNQFELAVIYAFTNAAVDANQLVMEMLQKVAERHGMKCLLHEKPFAGINGSGKHNNWSMGTDDGINLLDPGDKPQDNARFLVFCSAVLRAVDKWAKVLRVSAANTGNDLRLGANEAPPAIISVFLGDVLSDLFEKLSKGEKVKNAEGGFVDIGHSVLPKLPKDLTDRNRTSPFAFTGNKFEFRMVPSSDTVSGPNTILNMVVADVLMEFADRLEKAKDVNAEITKIVGEVWKENGKVVFNGNGYTEDWVKEAARRGLPNLKCTVEALPEMVKPDVIALFERQKVLSKAEVESRYVIYLEKYCKQINIEAITMANMARIQIFPAATKFCAELSGRIEAIKAAVPGGDLTAQWATLKEAVALAAELMKRCTELEELVADAKKHGGDDVLVHAKYFREKIVPKQAELRAAGDALEKLVDRDMWPFPTYSELLFKL